MNPIARAAELLMRCGQPDGVLPPTALFNEGWMLRLVLDWAANHRSSIKALKFEKGSTWYSEALIGSRFRSRNRRDTSGEGLTHADGVIGHFRLIPSGRGEIELLQEARQLTVIEAKMASGFSKRTKYAPSFNQAARNVACMCYLITKSGLDLGSITKCSFVLLAPAARIKEGMFEALDKALIARAVEERAANFDSDAMEWYIRSFMPFLNRCEVVPTAWEDVFKDIAAVEPVAGEGISKFYAQCLIHNPLYPIKAHDSPEVANIR